MLIIDVIQFLVSMMLIYFSADLIIKYGKIIAVSLGVSEYLIGLTLIAFGTSFPEFIVSVNASILDESSIVFGNIIGSNIANIAFVLSICAIINFIKIDNIKKEDIFFFLLSGIFSFIFCLDGVIYLFEGLILLFFFIIYCYRTSKNFNESKNYKKNIKNSFDIYLIIIVISSFFILVVGSNFFIDSAINLANRLNVSKVAISMTMVAIGTSLPELATSIVAINKKEYSLLIGNVVGSNIMNVFMILGPSAIINKIEVNIDYISLSLMISLTFLICIFNLLKIKISRILGCALLIIYIVFIYSNFF